MNLRIIPNEALGMEERVQLSPQYRLLLAFMWALPFMTLAHVAFEVELEFWRLPIATWIRAFGFGLPLAWMMRALFLRVPTFAVPFWILFTLGWVGFVVWKAIVGKKVIFGLFGLILTLLSYLWWGRMRNELARSYMHSGVRWFEAEPHPLPYVSAEVMGVPFRISRLDSEGVFVFGPESSIASLFQANGSRVEVTIRQETTGFAVNVLGEIAQEVHPRKSGLHRAGDWISGIGLRFVEPSVDRKKGLGDFVERLRGEGHVI